MAEPSKACSTATSNLDGESLEKKKLCRPSFCWYTVENRIGTLYHKDKK
jgi:hypothetical protein